MATTGFWPVKGRLKDVINYAENPDKTIERKYLDDDLAAALNYVENSDKTDRTMYVSGINCTKKRAYEQMMTTKRRYGKLGGKVAYHGYQSFQAGEVTPEEAHRIGIETAKRMWGDDYEIVVTTHLNTAIISGHRRYRAAQKAGLAKVPAFIRPVSRDEAAIMVVDSNLHREHLLPSEKAFAYKLKMEALSHQGASRRVGEKWSVEQVGESANESARQIHRYIRLTKLIPDILQMVDEQRIAFSVGVELSFLTENEQKDLFESIELEDKTPSLSQAIQMKKLSQVGKLDSETISKIISEEKPNQREKISFQYDELSKYFPKKFTPQDIYKRLLKLAQDDYRRRQRNREER